jgi:hypothetical protein
VRSGTIIAGIKTAITAITTATGTATTADRTEKASLPHARGLVNTSRRFQAARVSKPEWSFGP